MSGKMNKQTQARYITVFAAFLAFMGIGVVDPILPVIAEQIGANRWQIELLFTSYILMMAIMMIPSGILASRFGDKRMMVVGLAVVTLFAWLCGTSQGISSLSLYRAGWGMGNSMFFATTMTLLISLTPDIWRAVGLYEAAIGLGMAGGPLLGGILGSYTWRYPFYGTGVLILVAFLLAVFFVYDPHQKKQRKVAGGRQLLKLIQYRPFFLAALSAMFYYYGFFVVLAYSPLILKMSAIKLGLVFFGWGLLLGYGSAVLSHKLEKRYPIQRLLMYGLLSFVVVLAVLSFVHIPWLQIVFVILSGLPCGLNNALFTSYVMEISPYERSITSGAYNFVRWIGAALGPILSGVLGEIFFFSAPYIMAGLLVIIGILVIKSLQKTEWGKVQTE